jgi:hypothetical protein
LPEPRYTTPRLPDIHVTSLFVVVEESGSGFERQATSRKKCARRLFLRLEA